MMPQWSFRHDRIGGISSICYDLWVGADAEVHAGVEERGSGICI